MADIELVEKQLQALWDRVDARFETYATTYATIKVLEGSIANIKDFLEQISLRFESELRAVHQRMDAKEKADTSALEAAKDAVNVAMTASEKAVTKAEFAAEKRFESVNEFRAQMSDMQQTFARSDNVSIQMAAMQKKVDENAAILLEFRTGTVAKSTGYANVWGWVMGALVAGSALTGALFSLFRP